VLIVLCDDHRLFVEPVARALRLRGHEPVITTSPAEGIAAVEQHRPDVCVMDLRFPDGDGVAAVAALRQRHPWCPVVVVSGSDDPRDAAAAVRAGAVGVLHKALPICEIFDALDRVAAGEELTPAAVVPRPVASDERTRVRELVHALTLRERQVLGRLVEADDTVGIARSLGVSPSTARTHLQNVLLKLGVHSRLQAVALVVGSGVDREMVDRRSGSVFQGPSEVP
jgi:DNA-binding NarL/FixJ family response regulator